MAQTKTDYGLIYNDDGSLCTTVRPDQTPFPGVNSFAVETGTTNLVRNPQFLNGTANYSLYKWGGTGYIEVVNNIMNMHNESSTKHLALIQYSFTIDNTKEHTISCRVRSANGQDCPIEVWVGVDYYKIGTAPASGAWVTLERTYVPSELTPTTAMHFKISPGKYLQIDWLQFEQKPFASSFVNGTRPEGRLVIPVEDLKFDIANDDWVISYWKYPVATSDDTQNGYNTCSLGQWTSDNSLGYINWGKTDSNAFALKVTYSDSTRQFVYSDSFDPNWYFRNWHYEVMKKQGKVLSYYVDGVKQCELIIPADKELQTPFDVGLSLGGFIENNRFLPNNALIANVGNGELKPGEFTDEHIMAIYEANRAFEQKGGVKIY